MSAAFELDPAIDVDRLRSRYAETGCVQIAPFLAGSGAEALRGHLAERQDWVLAAQPGARRVIEFARGAFASLPPQQREAIARLAAPAEAEGFRYLFERITAVTDPGERPETGTLLAGFANFLASPAVLQLGRAITGAGDIDYADAHASAYGPGHFLTLHNDNSRGKGRRAAYVFGLTERWRPEWGGLLLFHDERGDVVRGLLPRMTC